MPIPPGPEAAESLVESVDDFLAAHNTNPYFADESRAVAASQPGGHRNEALTRRGVTYEELRARNRARAEPPAEPRDGPAPRY
jgi:hypothetical protein